MRGRSPAYSRPSSPITGPEAGAGSHARIDPPAVRATNQAKLLQAGCCRGDRLSRPPRWPNGRTPIARRARSPPGFGYGPPTSLTPWPDAKKRRAPTWEVDGRFDNGRVELLGLIQVVPLCHVFTEESSGIDLILSKASRGLMGISGPTPGRADHVDEPRPVGAGSDGVGTFTQPSRMSQQGV